MWSLMWRLTYAYSCLPSGVISGAEGQTPVWFQVISFSFLFPGTLDLGWILVIWLIDLLIRIVRLIGCNVPVGLSTVWSIQIGRVWFKIRTRRTDAGSATWCNEKPQIPCLSVGVWWEFMWSTTSGHASICVDESFESSDWLLSNLLVAVWRSIVNFFITSG